MMNVVATPVSELVRAKPLAAVAAAVLLMNPALSAAKQSSEFVPGRIGSTLGSADQIARDRLAVRLYASAPVQAAIRALEALYASDANAQLPDARTTLRRAAQATAMAQVVGVVNKDTDRPSTYWSVTAPHSWGRVKVPLSGLMLDNPDNIYRNIPIDGAASYEIRGRVIGTAPAQQTFIFYEAQTGVTKNQTVRTQQEENGMVTLGQLPLAADGSFTITLDSTPANGRVNHLQINPAAHDSALLVRDTLDDWSRENPVQLSIRRTAGPPLRPAKTEAELAQRAAELTATAGPYWLAWGHKVFFSRPTNTYTHIVSRVSGWGYIKCGHYNLEDDEALVIRIDRKQAASLGFQLSDVWGQGQSMNFIARTGSLNGSQSRANADGTYTYAISVSDPGVANWLDPDGLHAGTFCTRWQNLPAGLTTDDAVQHIGVVKLADLKHHFPEQADWITPAGRNAQRRERMENYRRRLGG